MNRADLGLLILVGRWEGGGGVLENVKMLGWQQEVGEQH